MRREIQEAYDQLLPKDPNTIMTITSFTEEEHPKAMAVLANKLYGMLVDKLEDTDFKEIEDSDGDITKFKYYTKTRESIAVLKELAIQSGSGEEDVKDIEKALTYLESNKTVFMKAFRLDIHILKYLYNTIVMAIIADIAYFTTVCVEFVKNPDHTVSMEINNVKKYKTKFYMVHESIKNFNKMVEKKQLEKVANGLMKVKAENFAAEITIAQYVGVVLAAAAGVFIILATVLIPIIRELAYLFFAVRVSVANYCAVQQKLLEANALRIKSNGGAKDVAERQLKIAAFFEKLSNFFAIKVVPAEKKIDSTLKGVKPRLTKDEVNGSDDDTLTLF